MYQSAVTAKPRRYFASSAGSNGRESADPAVSPAAPSPSRKQTCAATVSSTECNATDYCHFERLHPRLLEVERPMTDTPWKTYAEMIAEGDGGWRQTSVQELLAVAGERKAGRRIIA